MDVVAEFVENLPPGSVVISGGARGVDSAAGESAKRRGLGLVVHPAKWRAHKGAKYDRSAGFKRNQQIVKDCDYLVAFWDGESKGTMHSINLAIKSKKPLAVFGPEGFVVAEGNVEYDHDGGQSALENAMERVDEAAEAAQLPTIADALEALEGAEPTQQKSGLIVPGWVKP